MSCIGFFHPSRGYWQTISEPSAEILATYPEGTIEVPLKPGADHDWIGGAWVHNPPPPPTPEEARAALPPITRRQLRLTLVRNGISLSDVTQAIAAMPDGLAKEEAQIEWEDAATFERLHPTLLAIADGLGLTPEQVDDLWVQAMEA